MADLYLYDDVPVLRNSLGIKDENTLESNRGRAKSGKHDAPVRTAVFMTSPHRVSVKSTIFFLAIYMIGLANTALSTLKSVSDC